MINEKSLTFSVICGHNFYFIKSFPKIWFIILGRFQEILTVKSGCMLYSSGLSQKKDDKIWTTVFFWGEIQKS